MDTKMDTKEELAKLILDWWEEAQYWEAFPGRNQFDEDPQFVVRAKEILPNYEYKNTGE